MSSSTETPVITQTIPVFCAAHFRVVEGVNTGEPLSLADDLIPDDSYCLADGATRQMLTFILPDDPDDKAPLLIAPNSRDGTAGNRLYTDCCLTLIAPDSTTIEAIVLVETEKESGTIAEVYLLPLAAITPKTDYRLIGIDRQVARARLAEAACASFARGTRITMANGEQRPIEDLRVGDKVLTRDDGIQPVRWIGRSIQRAVGEFAPVLITKGVLNNENDLLLNPNHRLFIYQRVDAVGAGRSEVLVKAKHLVNGTTVRRQSGGFVEYFQLLFDEHQIVFAEGIAAESLMLDERTTAALPTELIDKALMGRRRHSKRPHEDFEIETPAISDEELAERLRKASST
ncbi:MAG TPA: hypothetical protein ENJ91_01535 [Rhodobacteraceae bacterium]|nr:hypothetical protein [Paracoccaceae bacterium]